MIGDHFQDKWTQPDYNRYFNYPYNQLLPGVSKEEFEKLKKEVEEMKQLLIKAKIYDEQNHEPNCEMEDKISLLKKIAELVGVDLKEVFK
jgi:hypothetical protein